LKKGTNGKLSVVPESEAKNGNINTVLVDNAANSNWLVNNAKAITTPSVQIKSGATGLTTGNKAGSNNNASISGAAKALSNTAVVATSSLNNALETAKKKGWILND
jgi:hypothetical protein